MVSRGAHWANRLGVGALLLLSLSAAASVASAAVLPQSCTPRPPVTVSVAPTGQVTISASTSSGVPSNALQSLQFGAATNAVIDAGSQTGQTGNFTVTLPAGTQQTTFVVHSATAGQATT